MARPKIVIDANQVKQLAQIGCSYPEMAAVLGCGQHTLIRRFANAVKKGKEHLKASLRRMQYKSASEGSVAMQIWLGKQYLGQSEKMEVTNNELMREEIEIIPRRGKQYERYSNAGNRLTNFINN